MKTKSKMLSAAVLSMAAVVLVAADAAKKPAIAAKPAPVPASAVIPQKDLVPPGAGKDVKKAPVTFESVLAFLPANVAVIDGKNITKAQFIAFLKDTIGATPELLAALPEPQRKSAVAKVLNQYVEQHIVSTMARKDGFVPSEKLAREFFDLTLKKIPPAQLKQIEAQLKMRGMTMEAYKNKLIKEKASQEQAAMMMWIEKKFRNNVKVLPAEVQEFYKKHPEFFTVPERVSASHILIAPDKAVAAKDKAKADAEAKAKAEKILAALKKGADFGETALKESSCPSGKQSKGVLPPFAKGEMVSAFEKAAFAMKPGEMSGLVKTEFGYHIIKVTGKEAGSVRPLQTVTPEIENYLKGQKFEKALRGEVEQMKKKMNVKISAF